ncbi:GxxExxY protein [Pollutibacter soli]|uniref:GxxExxY protein n=1 Tax=Pollutibacter soli TaxID=3034157 RepID=UPI0030132413
MIFKIYNTLGPGLLESAYEFAIIRELNKRGLKFKRQVGLPMYYDGDKLDIGYRIDFVVENKVIIEVKSVEALANTHHKQIITYLRLSELKLGLLVNFNTDNIGNSIIRKVNNL